LEKKEKKIIEFTTFFFWFSLKISLQVPNFTPEKRRKKAAPNPTLGDICEVMGFY
jgi:hypothetical protein